MLDKLGSALAQALATLALKRGSLASQAKPSNARGNARAAQSRASAGNSASFEQRVRQRLLALDPDDPGLRHKAFHTYVELRLLSEFGARLGNEPQFHALVDDVVRTMESIPELKCDIDRAVDHLLVSPGP